MAPHRTSGCWTGLVKKAEPQASDVVTILGAGIIGLGALAKLRDVGVSRIIVSDVSEKRLKVARELGATYSLIHQRRHH